MDQLTHDQLFDAAKAANDDAALAALLPSIPVIDPARLIKLNCCAWAAANTENPPITKPEILSAFAQARALAAKYSIMWWKVSLNLLASLNIFGAHSKALALAAELQTDVARLPAEVLQWQYYIEAQSGYAHSLMGHVDEAVECRQRAVRFAPTVELKFRLRMSLAAGYAKQGLFCSAVDELNRTDLIESERGFYDLANAYVHLLRGNVDEAEAAAASAQKTLPSAVAEWAARAEAHLVIASAAHLAHNRPKCILHARTALLLSGGIETNDVARLASALLAQEGVEMSA